MNNNKGESKMTQQKNLVFQVNIKMPENVYAETTGKRKFYHKDNLYAFSNTRAKQYADKVGADYYLLTDPELFGTKWCPNYHKFYMYTLFEQGGYDNILFLDSDAVLTPQAPNIFDMYKGFSAPIDQNLNSKQGQSKQARLNKHMKLSPDWNYFISGTMLVDRKFYRLTKDLWYDAVMYWKDAYKWSRDQSVFNVLAHNNYGEYNVLNKDWGVWWATGKYINHYAGYQSRNWTADKQLKAEARRA